MSTTPAATASTTNKTCSPVRYGITKSRAGHWTFWYQAGYTRSVNRLGRWYADQLVACVRGVQAGTTHDQVVAIVEAKRAELGV